MFHATGCTTTLLLRAAQAAWSYLLGILVLSEGLEFPGIAGAALVALGVSFIAAEPK